MTELTEGLIAPGSRSVAYGFLCVYCLGLVLANGEMRLDLFPFGSCVRFAMGRLDMPVQVNQAPWLLF